MGISEACGVSSKPVAVAVLALLMAAVLVSAPGATPRADAQASNTLGTPEPQAQAEEESHDRVSFTIGNDVTTAYFFRGILQERNGFIDQPYGEMSIKLYKSDGLISTVDASMGIWSSIQTVKTDASGSGPSNLYETDYYPSLSVGSSTGLSTSLTYRVQTSPNGAFTTVEELDLGLAFDDSSLLGPLAIGPTATFAFDLTNSSFADTKGGYMEFRGAPRVELSLPGDEDGNYPISASFPLAVGLSLYDYYKTLEPTHNQTFGFFSFGANAEIPLAFIPDDFGSWSASAGIEVLVLSQTLKQVNKGDNPFPIGMLGIVMEY